MEVYVSLPQRQLREDASSGPVAGAEGAVARCYETPAQESQPGEIEIARLGLEEGYPETGEDGEQEY